MWRAWSLKARINALVALLLLLGLGVNVSRLVLEAGPRVQAEDESVLRLSREFIEATILALDESSNPDRTLQPLVDGLRHLRHLSVARAGEAEPSNVPDDPDDLAVPGWFVGLIHPERVKITVPVTIRGRDLGAIVIASNPIDEIAEIWEGILDQVYVGSAIVVVLFVATKVVIDRALRPIGAVSGAMEQLEGGDYGARVLIAGAPELAAICRRLNSLGAALGSAVEEKRRLAERVVSLQDDERKDLARELHDEFGPFLFSIRAHATSLVRRVTRAPPDRPDLAPSVQAILDHVDSLQRANRRVLERLRPVALSELGLEAALEAMIALWRETYPAVRIESQVSVALDEIGEIGSLTIYRVVQEALTNVFRHAGATRIDIAIHATRESRPGEAACLIRIRDNGVGLPIEARRGLGLTGMRERVMALGGRMAVASRPSGGVEIEALVPYGGSGEDGDGLG